VSGGGVQDVASDTPDVLIKLLDMDAIEEGEPPDEWRPPDLVIHDRERFEAYTSGEQTPPSVTLLSLTPPHPSAGFFCLSYGFEPSHRLRTWLIHEHNS
jgi:hypothetical protein